MNLRAFSFLKGKHAKLSPSQAARWANKDLEKDELFKMISSKYATEIGTLLHKYAEDAILTRTKIYKTDKKEVRKWLIINGIPERIAYEYSNRTFYNLMIYVNDCIGYRMEPEVELGYISEELAEKAGRYVEPICFGTADAISYKNNLLRISDYKSGVTPAHMEQLMTYAALFCMQNNLKPGLIKIELRMYQLDGVIYHEPEADEILPIMDRIVRYDKWLTALFD